MIRQRALALAISASTVGVAGCDTGDIAVTTFGEDFIEEGIPAEFFSDGSSVTFSSFIVTLADITVAGADGTDGGTVAGPAVFDVQKAGPSSIATLKALAPRHYEAVTAAIVPATDATVAGNVDGAALDLMKSQGFSVFVQGAITLADVEKTFSWGFASNTRYVDCETEDGPGIEVVSGAATELQLTIHGEHLFFDGLDDEASVLRTEALMAADANTDNVIDIAELAAVDLSDLPAGQYGTGGNTSVITLADFMAAQSGTLVHLNGDGECTAEKR